jgi:peptidoglycan/LPS O-acetylase OafA/YrhL
MIIATETRSQELRGRERSGDIPALTGLRFIAALSVVLAHSSYRISTFEPPDIVGGWMARLGPFGMTLFFVLSGFVIHYNYRSLVLAQGWTGFGAFLWARFARLYPLFLLILTFDILSGSSLFDFVAGNVAVFRNVLRSLPYYLLFMQSWVYLPLDDRTLIDAVGGTIALSWSISTEWFFYLAYPSIAWLVVRARHPIIILGVMVGWSLLWGCLASIVSDNSGELEAWAVARYGTIAAAGTSDGESFIRWLQYYSPYLRIGEFVLGCLTAQLYLQQRHRTVGRREQAIGTLLLVIGLVSIPLIIFLCFSQDHRSALLSSMRNNYALAPTVALVLFSAARYQNPISRLLQGRLLVALGEASYSIYLTHLIVFIFITGYVTRILPTTAPYIAYLILRLAFAVLMICLISVGLHATVEVPARNWLRGLWRPTRTGRRALAISVASMPAAAALVALVLATLPLQTETEVAAGIRVISATYGANCGVARGNITWALVNACDGRNSCDYVVDVTKLGDPAGGCAKDFNVNYACMPDNSAQTTELAGEAGLGSHAALACPAPP